MAFDTPEEYLQYYYEQYGPFRVQLLMGRALNWVNYGTKEYEIYEKEISPATVNNRERMSDEVIYDIEAPKIKGDLFDVRRDKIVKETTNEILDRLKKIWKLSYGAFKSGGTGNHIHLFFEELRKLNKYDRDTIKQLLLKKIGRGYLTPTDDKGKIDLTKGWCIQLEQANHRKGGTKTLIEEHYVGNNKIPKIVLKEFNQLKKRRIHYKPKALKTIGDKPSCISYFENDSFVDYRSLEDGRHRACFVLAAYYAQNGLKNKIELTQHLKTWNEVVCRGHLPDAYIYSQIKSVFNYTGRKMGCTYRKNLLDDLGMRRICAGCPYQNGWKKEEKKEEKK